MTTPNTILKQVLSKLKNTNITTLTKTVRIEHTDYMQLLSYIDKTFILNTLNYTETLYKTKAGYTRTRVQYFITDSKGNIINISHVLFLLYKKYMSYIKLNVKHNYIIGNLTTSTEIFARLSNYMRSKNKQEIRTLHLITPYVM